MRNLKTWFSGLTIAILVAGCATTPEPEMAEDGIVAIATEGGMISAVMGPDGKYIAVDENGNEVKDTPEAIVLLGLLQAMQGGPDFTDEQIWVSDEDGNLTHIQSGGICPLEWGQFTLAKPNIYNRNGLDVGCNYQSQPLQSVFTFYFYKNPVPLSDEIDEVMAGIKARVPTGKPVSDLVTMPTVEGPALYQVRMIESVGSDGIKTRDGVFLTDDDGWRLKLRVTYPTSRATEIETLVSYMLHGQIDQINPQGAQTEPVAQPGDEDKIST